MIVNHVLKYQLVVKGLQDNITITQLGCGKDFSIADSNGNVYVWGSIEDGHIANVLCEQMIFERNERRNKNPCLNTGDNNNNNSGAPNGLYRNLRERIEATQAPVRGVAQEEEKRDEKKGNVMIIMIQV